MTTDFAAGNDTGNDLAIGADGKIVVAGIAESGPHGGTDFALARYFAV